ncbi:hypothetical protein [Mesorhizobium sp. M1B.F.Ca.ET.045.04.1.1]|uniref:hypothetical protein n=1 Tax=Mesorhizobium sp. M1B.F.Ca.ET.045.04.1.1 TaxID=2493673 RepID=UPI001FDF2917|nr:hypothetical protein [Mesorhizobium sp. M1B.F.Ca.ET.045.04.1.1]
MTIKSAKSRHHRAEATHHRFRLRSGQAGRHAVNNMITARACAASMHSDVVANTGTRRRMPMSSPSGYPSSARHVTEGVYGAARRAGASRPRGAEGIANLHDDRYVFSKGRPIRTGRACPSFAPRRARRTSRPGTKPIQAAATADMLEELESVDTLSSPQNLFRLNTRPPSPTPSHPTSARPDQSRRVADLRCAASGRANGKADVGTASFGRGARNGRGGEAAIANRLARTR